MGQYLNLNACTVGEVPSFNSCPQGSAQGVANWGYISKSQLTGCTINASGLCSTLTFTSGKTFFTMNPEPETVQVKINNQTNKYKNTTVTATLTGTIGGWDDTLRDMFTVMQKNNGHIWFQLLSGEYILMGVDNTTTPAASMGAKLTKQEWDSGIDSESEYSGVAFEFTAKSSTKLPRILSSIMTTAVTN